MTFNDPEILGLLEKYQYLDAVKRYEEKYSVTMREALAVIRPLWRELRGRTPVTPTERPAKSRPSNTRRSKDKMEKRKPKKPVVSEPEQTVVELEPLEMTASEDELSDLIPVIKSADESEQVLEPPPPPEPATTKNQADEIIALLQQGDMEAAARKYESAYNVSITEAINEVFKWKKNLEQQAAAKAKPEPKPKAEPQKEYKSGQTYSIAPEIIELVKQGNKIGAIKRFREIYNTSLADSKKFIDEIDSRL